MSAPQAIKSQTVLLVIVIAVAAVAGFTIFGARLQKTHKKTFSKLEGEAVLTGPTPVPVLGMLELDKAEGAMSGGGIGDRDASAGLSEEERNRLRASGSEFGDPGSVGFKEAPVQVRQVGPESLPACEKMASIPNTRGYRSGGVLAMASVRENYRGDGEGHALHVRAAVQYIRQELATGHPVIAGIHRARNRATPEAAIGDFATDHFVLVWGLDVVADGSVVVRYVDPAAPHTYEASGELRLDRATMLLRGKAFSGEDYQMTYVRANPWAGDTGTASPTGS